MITATEHTQLALYFRRCANSLAWMATTARNMGDPREAGYRGNADAMRKQSRQAAAEARAARRAVPA